MKGQCPICLGMFTIKKDGTLYTHLALVAEPDRDYRGNKCPGAGELPREKRPLWR